MLEKLGLAWDIKVPTAAEIEKKLHERGILVVPDFVANAGGVISSYVEYKGGKAKSVFRMIEEKVKGNTLLVLAEAERKKCIPRDAVMEIAVGRVKKAMKKR